MRNLRLLRAGGCRSAAATGTPQCFCLSAEPGAVLVGSQYGLVELRPAGDSVRAAAAGQGSGACRRVGVGFGCKAGLKRLRPRQRELAGNSPVSWRGSRFAVVSARSWTLSLFAAAACCCLTVPWKPLHCDLGGEEAFCACKILYLPF